MIVTIFGATGMVGKELIVHCQAKGYQIRAFGRNIEKLIDEDLRDNNFEAIKGSVFDADDILNAITGADAVLTALGGALDGRDFTRSLGVKNIVTQMEKAGVKRIISIGGKGILNIDAETFDLEMDSTDYPQQYLPVAGEHLKAYQSLADSGLDWTFVCPPDIIDAPANGKFETKASSSTGGSNISAGNLALFMVVELTKNEFVKEKVSISNT
ncbi:MAG: NAD(P)H-binding protein [Chitinophagaceae bacterium]